VTETLAIEPGDRILEVGCGHGVTASLVCERLTAGRFTAIDRSRKMIDMAARRNRQHVASGRARFEAAALEDADLGDERFDKVFAVHVAQFWLRPAESLGVVRKVLAPGGALHLFNQAPGWTPETARGFGERLSEVFREHGYSVEEVAMGPACAVCVRGRPA
jgi:ubiquinone/menaquinone biosynthesis C-methylase UbiE